MLRLPVRSLRLALFAAGAGILLGATACEPTTDPGAPGLPDDSAPTPPPDDGGDPPVDSGDDSGDDGGSDDDSGDGGDDDGSGDGGGGDVDGEVTFDNAFPRVAAFAGNWDFYTSDERDALADFDLVSLRAAPDAVEHLRRLNPDIELFYRVMPQLVPQTDWGFDWSWLDIVRRYAEANDWILRHHNGSEAIARGWGTYWRWGDFTSNCPLGTYVQVGEADLDSRGLTMAEWMATRFIPWFRDNKMTGYDGMWWEVVCEEVNPYWFHTTTPFSDGGTIDWNRNGVSDAAEGESERFAADWDSVSTWWMDESRDQLGTLPVIGGGDRYAPPIEQFDGFKNEDFLNRNRWAQPYWTWWDEFYVTQLTRPRRGYVYQRDHQRGGWEYSINQIFWNDGVHQGHSDPARLDQFLRFSLGTTLLGDGFFCYYDLENPTGGGQPRIPWVSELYDLRLGSDGHPFERVTVGPDTLYVREFHDGHGVLTGRVTVNPNGVDVGGVPAEDALFEVFEGRRSR